MHWPSSMAWSHFLANWFSAYPIPSQCSTSLHQYWTHTDISRVHVKAWDSCFRDNAWQLGNIRPLDSDRLVFKYFGFCKWCFILNWRIILLHPCVGSCHASAWVNHRSTYTCSLLYLPHLPNPSRLSPSTRFGFPASYSKFPLVFCFTCGNIYISMLLAQIIPPTSSLTLSNGLISCLCLLCYPADRISSTIFLDSVRTLVNVWYLSSSFWLPSPCGTGSRFVHLIRTDSHVFLLTDEQHSLVCMFHSFFIQSPVNGHLGCFHVLATVNGAAMRWA